MSKPELDISSEEIVEYILKTNSTIRETANQFGCSKTLIWSRLKKYNGASRSKLDELFNKNKSNSIKNLKNYKGN